MKIPAARPASKLGFKLGFTLLDLLALGCLLAVVAMLMIPVWAASAAEVRARLCAGNLGQVGRAMALYASDHDDTLPGNQHSQPSWVRSLAGYCSTNTYLCPEEIVTRQNTRLFTIALNDFLTPHPYGARELNFSKQTKVAAPAETIAFAEADQEYRAYDHFHFADAREHGYAPEAFAAQVDVERHTGSANYLFLDSHVDHLAWSSGAQPKLNYPTSRFVHPAGHLNSAELARK